MDIQTHVQNVIRDIIDLCDFKLEVSRETMLSVTRRGRPDLLVIRSKGAVVGVCEIRRPSTEGGDLSDPILRNRISNCMLATKYSHGLTKPFAILSTYNEWKICWLEDTVDQINEILPPREIFCETKTFHRSDPSLAEALVAAIMQMNLSSIVPPPSTLLGRGDNRKFPLVGLETSVKWSALPTEIDELYYELPAPRTEEFYLLEDFHGGADGRVWLATNSTGHLCVLKFSDLLDSELEREAETWRTIWDARFARVMTLADCKTVVMPFTFHAYLQGSSMSFRGLNKWASDDRSVESILSSEVNVVFDMENLRGYYDNPWKVAQEALTALANAGFEHADLCWRHVALLPVFDDMTALWKVRPVLIDMSHLNDINGRQIQDVVQAGIDLLLGELDANHEIMLSTLSKTV